MTAPAQAPESHDVRWKWFGGDSALDLPGVEEWVDPFEPTAVWASTRFRRVAAALADDGFGHLVAFEGDQPVLSAPVIGNDGPGGLLFYDPAAMIGDERAFGDTASSQQASAAGGSLDASRASLYPTLAVGTYGSQHGILVDPRLDTAARHRLCAQLADEVAGLAERRGCRSHALLYLSAAALPPLRPASGALQPAVLGAEARIVTTAQSFEAYLDELSRSRRRAIRYERRSAQEGGLEVSVQGGTDALADDLVELRCALRARYGLPDRRADTVREFEALRRWCGDGLVVSRCRKDGATGGFTIFVRQGERLAARTAGFDDQRLRREDYAYFNTTYYAPLAWGLERGIRSFDFGLSSYAAKRTRGCRFEPRFGLFSLPSGHPMASVLAAQDRAERDRLAAECRSALVGPVDPERVEEEESSRDTR